MHDDLIHLDAGNAVGNGITPFVSRPDVRERVFDVCRPIAPRRLTDDAVL